MPLTADAGEPLLHTGTPGVSDTTFRQTRQLTQAVSEGVVGAGDLKVTAPGGMNVAVAAGYAFISGTVITGPDGQHKYGVPLTAAKTLGTISAPVGATRRDTVIFRVYDEGDAPGYGGLNIGRVEYLPNPSETLVAQAIPPNSIELAWVDVPVGAVAISAQMIRERRKKSRAVTDDTIDRLMQLCWAGGQGIAPEDQSRDCTITAMGTNKATDFEISTGGSGLTLSVAAGNAWVQNDTDKGLSFIRSTAAVTIATDAAHATLPRIDRVVLDERGAVYVVKGTATAGATLANLTGATAEPADVMTLGYVLVPAAFAGPFVTATHVLDVRCFAYRPGRVIGRLSANSTVAMPADVFALTVVGNGVNDVQVDFDFEHYNSVAGNFNRVYLGDAPAIAGTTYRQRLYPAHISGTQQGEHFTGNVTALAGRKTLYLYGAVSAGAGAFYGAGTENRDMIARYV